MAEQLTVPLIPPAGRPAGHGRGPRRLAPLPLAALPDVPPGPAELVYGMGRVEASGRVGDRAVVRAMGWQAGELLTITAANGVILARRDDSGRVAVGGRGHFAIPAALRGRCGLTPGMLVLLAGRPDGQLLAACSLALLDQAIRALLRVLADAGGDL